MALQHENYRHLIWTLAKTDFTLRYHGSVLGYVWALLKPLLLFSIMYFVFSNIFNPRALGNTNYAVDLLTGIILFNFFAEGTTAGMSALLTKAQLVTKIYVPRWTLIVAATLNSLLLFLMNLIILIIFFAWQHLLPSVIGLVLFGLFICLTYILIVGFGLLMAPLFVRFRDVSMIWEVAITALMYASPIIYPLTLMPSSVRQIILLNPIAFIIHFSKESLVHQHYPDILQIIGFTLVTILAFGLCVLSYRKMAPRIAEYL